MDHNNNNNLATASFDIMNVALIPTKIINTVIPSIPVISNNILNTSTETTMHECDNLNDYKIMHGNIANYNNDFDLKMDDLSDFMDSTEKNDATAQPTLVTSDRIEDKSINTVTPSIPAISNNVLNNSTETTMNEHDNLSDY